MKKRIIVVSLLALGTFLVLTACAAPVEEESGAVEKTIYVGPQLVDCVGVGPQTCMQVKEDPEAEYTLFYNQIDGFTYEEGYEYELLVREDTIDNPPADASSIKWTLIDEVSKTAVGEVATEPTEVTNDSTPTTMATEGEVLTVYIGPELVECVGVAPQTCLQVKTDPDHDYTLFYDTIVGFEFESGYEYELLVRVDPVENPPADASNIQYTLVEQVSKTPASSDIPTDAGDVTMDEGTSSIEEATLDGKIWLLVSYAIPDGQTMDVLPDSRITAEFSEGQVAGTAGCNRYFASYETDGTALTIGPAGSTMMSCSPEEIMLQETAYLALLSSVASYDFADEQLQLKNSSGESVLLFAEETPLSLTDVSWNLVSYNNGLEAMVSVIVDTTITANFSEDGVLSGSAGCNSYSGSYESEDNNITIGNIANTEMFCMSPEGIMEQEMQYLTALQNAAVYRIDGTILEIRDANGAGVAYYEATEPVTLAGKTWNLLFHNNGQGGMVSTITGTQITAVFDDEGNLAGSAGCNNYTAAYQSDDEKIQIGPAITTRMFCAEPEGIMQQEGQYLAALENAGVYLIEGNKLEIRDVEGAGVATYEVLDESVETADEAATSDPSMSKEVTVPAEIVEALGNSSYPLDYTGNGIIQLTGGEFREPAAPDSAAENVTQLTEHIAMGELSSGQSAVAVILVSQTGGTGTFYDLAVLQEQDGVPSNPVLTYLGDRIVVNNLAIENGQIVVDMIVQGPEDPFCCPTQEVISTYELDNGELVQISNEVIGTFDPQAEDSSAITKIVWKWQELITPLEEMIIDDPENYTVEFKEDSTLFVTADCNFGSGTYRLEGSSLFIDIRSTTLNSCPEGSLSNLLFSSLNNAGSYFMDGNDLMIDQVADSGTLRFSR